MIEFKKIVIEKLLNLFIQLLIEKTEKSLQGQSISGKQIVSRNELNLTKPPFSFYKK